MTDDCGRKLYMLQLLTNDCMLTFLRHALFYGNGTVWWFVISLLVELSDHKCAVCHKCGQFRINMDVSPLHQPPDTHVIFSKQSVTHLTSQISWEMLFTNTFQRNKHSHVFIFVVHMLQTDSNVSVLPPVQTFLVCCSLLVEHATGSYQKRGVPIFFFFF